MNSKFRLEIEVSDNFSKELKKLNRKIRRLKRRMKLLRIYDIILNFFNGEAVKLREVCRPTGGCPVLYSILKFFGYKSK